MSSLPELRIVVETWSKNFRIAKQTKQLQCLLRHNANKVQIIIDNYSKAQEFPYKSTPQTFYNCPHNLMIVMSSSVSDKSCQPSVVW